MQSRKLLKEQPIYIRDKRNGEVKTDENNTSVLAALASFTVHAQPLTDRRTNSPAYLSEL